MDLQVLIRIIAFLVYILLLVTWPARKKKICTALGKCILPLQRKKSSLFILVVVFAPVLILLTYFRNFGTMINFVLCASAILAVEVSIRDNVYNKLSGIYKNGMIVDGRYFLFNQITALPELGYEKENTAEDQDELYSRSMKIVTEDSGIIYVGFVSKEEKESAIKVILEQEPRLKP